MKKNTVTIKDVAKEAGVSVATVSYVINDNKEQSIKEETRQKIWQVVNMLNYKPNVFAKNLRMAQDKKLIAVCFQSQEPLFKAQNMLILENLFKVFQGDYELVFKEAPFVAFNDCDAIITYNVCKETFHEVGNLNFVPLIALDTLINDPLFFQITTDYELLKEESNRHFKEKPYTFVTLDLLDEALKEEIIKTFKEVIFIKDFNELLKLHINNVSTDNLIINNYFKDLNLNIYYNELKLSLKCEQVKTCLNLALSRDQVLIHNYKI